MTYPFYIRTHLNLIFEAQKQTTNPLDSFDKVEIGAEVSLLFNSTKLLSLASDQENLTFLG